VVIKILKEINKASRIHESNTKHTMAEYTSNQN